MEHYRNGDAIPDVQDNEMWRKLKTGAWCYGHFDLIGYYGGWWSKTVNDSSTWSRDLSFNVAAAYRHSSLYGYGLSIRCVKD